MTWNRFCASKNFFLPRVLCSIAAPRWIFLLYFVSRSVQPRCLWRARLSLARLRARASRGTSAVCFLNITRRRWLAARPIDPSHRIKVSMGAAEFAVGPHPERAVRGSRRCPKEWQVLKRLQEGLTAASALSSPCIKGESSLWQFTPLHPPLSVFPPSVLWGSWTYSPLPGPSMSKHEWVQSKRVPHTSTQTHTPLFPPPLFALSFLLPSDAQVPSPLHDWPVLTSGNHRDPPGKRWKVKKTSEICTLQLSVSWTASMPLLLYSIKIK